MMTQKERRQVARLINKFSVGQMMAAEHPDSDVDWFAYQAEAAVQLFENHGIRVPALSGYQAYLKMSRKQAGII